MTPAFRAVVRKEIRQITRDRRMIPMLVVAPVIQLVVFGYAVNFEVNRVETVVCDGDRTAQSRAIVRSLEADGTFHDIGPARDCGRIENEVVDGRAQAALLVPRGLARDLAAERPAEVQVLVDGSNPTIGRFAALAASGAVDLQGMRVLRERVARQRGLQGAEVALPALQPEPRLFYNPQMKSPLFMVPGVAAMLLLVVTTIATAMGLARERELGTLEQVMVTPVRPGELILGKVTPFVAVGLLDVLATLTVGSWVFDVPIRGSLWLLALGTVLYVFSTVGLGLFISTVSRTQQQAFMGGFLAMMPAILLSGVMTPVENMPSWLQPIAWINPVKYYVEVLRGILLKAADIRDLWRPLGALFVFGVLILTLAVARFRKRLA
ncbi:MAG: ABC transporter permease [Deltaproteobacteria bacterium]|nr:ABC transporter permease [Deltaproteobacteria bacterium]